MSDDSQTFLSELSSQLLDQLIRIGRSEERHLGSPISSRFKHTERCLGEHNGMRDLSLWVGSRMPCGSSRKLHQGELHNEDRLFRFYFLVCLHHNDDPEPAREHQTIDASRDHG